MKILVTGAGGKAGSWVVRGQQIGAALDANVVPRATVADCRAVDVILVVKRCPDDLLAIVRASGRRWAYDFVDAYPQPACTLWSQQEAIAWARGTLARLRPNAVIWPNARMRADVGWSDGPERVIQHHHRPGIERNPIRETIRVIGYEGRRDYLQGWERTIDEQCRRLGAVFMVNPQRLSDLDVVLALRGGNWNGYPQQNWKSGVKLANAHASGTPFVGAPEAGYEEIAVGCEYWASNPRELATALDWMADQRTRREISERFVKATFTVEQAAIQVQEVLCELNS